MRIRILLILAFVFSVMASKAQDYNVISMEHLPMDMAAREYIKQDERGRQCAVLRIATQNIASEERPGFHFECDYASYAVERQIVEGEIWVWVSPRLNTLKIKHSRLGNIELHTANYGITIESLHTYKIVLQGTFNQGVDKHEVTQQYLVFQLTPHNAVLEVDGQLWEVGPDGTAMKFVNFGTYSYRVQAPNYLPKIGEVTVDDPNNTETESVVLLPDFVEVTLEVDADAEIWVNNEKKGIRTWTGSLGKGTYKIECKQEGYETSMISKEITAEMNGQTITLPAPRPFYGSLNVESTPIGATIYIDGKEMGRTPRSINEILVGEHELRLTKDGYSEYSETVAITKGERKQVKFVINALENEKSSTSVNYKEEETFTVNGVSFTMKFVEGGIFQMGGNEADSDEKPVHSVTLNSYYMGETEVTQVLWQVVMGNNPSYFKGNSLPVEQVSWNDCQEFIRELNQKTGKNFRLPTEAEWEYAARGGKKSNGYKYAGSNNIDSVAWYTDNSGSKTHPVKGKSSNELGLYDMSGNVWEWCFDKTVEGGPNDIVIGYYSVKRGGGMANEKKRCMVSERSRSEIFEKNHVLGLRLACPIED